VQIIPGGNHGSVQVTCIDCSSDTGKIAACYGSKVHVYEPSPLFHRTSQHRLDYQWTETAVLHCDSIVTALTWNQEGGKTQTKNKQFLKVGKFILIFQPSLGGWRDLFLQLSLEKKTFG
jgi:hypothetical protein